MNNLEKLFALVNKYPELSELLGQIKDVKKQRRSTPCGDLTTYTRTTWECFGTDITAEVGAEPVGGDGGQTYFRIEGFPASCYVRAFPGDSSNSFQSGFEFAVYGDQEMLAVIGALRFILGVLEFIYSDYYGCPEDAQEV